PPERILQQRDPPPERAPSRRALPRRGARPRVPQLRASPPRQARAAPTPRSRRPLRLRTTNLPQPVRLRHRRGGAVHRFHRPSLVVLPANDTARRPAKSRAVPHLRCRLLTRSAAGPWLVLRRAFIARSHLG